MSHPVSAIGAAGLTAVSAFDVVAVSRPIRAPIASAAATARITEVRRRMGEPAAICDTCIPCAAIVPTSFHLPVLLKATLSAQVDGVGAPGHGVDVLSVTRLPHPFRRTRRRVATGNVTCPTGVPSWAGRVIGHMPPYKEQGVVLRSIKLGEADKIVTVMTQGSGKVRAVAKGIRQND